MVGKLREVKYCGLSVSLVADTALTDARPHVVFYSHVKHRSANRHRNALTASMLGSATVLGVIDVCWGRYHRIVVD